MSLTRIALFSLESLPDYKENIESMTAFTVQLKEGRILNRQQRSALLVSSTSWTGMLSLTMHCFTIQLQQLHFSIDLFCSFLCALAFYAEICLATTL